MEIGTSQSQLTWERDPKHILFSLARYKFVAKMLAGKEHVVEFGCGDGFGAHLVAREVGWYMGIDVDGDSIAQAVKSRRKNMRFQHRDIFDCWNYHADAAFSLDVIEHIAPENQSDYLTILSGQSSVCIIGTPSLESQKYASDISKDGHVNCKSGDDLKKTLEQHWSQVFLFSMNDECLHTGFYPMAHYLMAVCVR